MQSWYRANRWRIIEPAGNARFGFTAKRWDEDSFLAVKGKAVDIVFATAKSEREWLRLIAAIEAQGLTVRIVRPRPEVQRSLGRLGFAGAQGVWARRAGAMAD